ncbi:MAG: TetR/AcrR family transcriptional regulator [Ignavibacteria bacterium]|nr:TetR/AcrR family transcriptional regulator [Ignavibacteria bacterium]
MNTEEKILEAAKKVFTRNGYAAARMDEIASEAGINRALLHYYFRSKDKLFQLIFEERFEQFFSGVAAILSSDKTIFQKVTSLVEHELNTLIKHPDIPIFVLNEINRNPDFIIQRMKTSNINVHQIFGLLDTQLKAEAAAGIIKELPVVSFFFNVMGLCIYPFVARNLISALVKMPKNETLELLRNRKEEITRFIIDGLRP